MTQDQSSKISDGDAALSQDQIKRVVEAVLMASDKPLSTERLIGLFDEHNAPSKSSVKDALAQLQMDYAGRGVQLSKIANGYRFQSANDLAPWVSRLWEERPQRYSRALLETLALIAYRQPITRGEIEEVRGVAVSSHIMKTLLERQWVKVVGHREVPGRPAIYATTKMFLDYFDLDSLERLPPLSEMRDIDAIAKDISQQLELGELEDSENSGSNQAVNSSVSDEAQSDVMTTNNEENES